MNVVAKIGNSIGLPSLVDRAARALAGARTSAEILEARDLASVAYDAAKITARLAKAKGAHDTLIAAAHRAQADALEIEAGAKRRLADEYDAAQERGEVPKAGNPNFSRSEKLGKPDIEPQLVHEARELRDAEESDPGIVRRTLDEALDAGEEPTRAKVKRAVKAKSKRQRLPRRNLNSPAETQHDRDLRALLGVWESACASARDAFLQTIAPNGYQG